MYSYLFLLSIDHIALICHFRAFDVVVSAFECISVPIMIKARWVRGNKWMFFDSSHSKKVIFFCIALTCWELEKNLEVRQIVDIGPTHLVLLDVKPSFQMRYSFSWTSRAKKLQIKDVKLSLLMSIQARHMLSSITRWVGPINGFPFPLKKWKSNLTFFWRGFFWVTPTLSQLCCYWCWLADLCFLTTICLVWFLFKEVTTIYVQFWKKP